MGGSEDDIKTLAKKALKNMGEAPSGEDIQTLAKAAL